VPNDPDASAKAIKLSRYELFRPTEEHDALGEHPWIARDATLHRRVWVYPVDRPGVAESTKRALGQSSQITNATVASVLDVLTVAQDDPSRAALEAAGLPVPGVYVVIEHVDAQPLERWLDAHARGAPELRTVLRDVATALDEVHARGMVHGQVGAEFVLVDRLGRAHLSLFAPERGVIAPDVQPHAAPSPQDDALHLFHLGRLLVGRLGFAARTGARDLIAIFEDPQTGAAPSLAEMLERLGGSAASSASLRLGPESSLSASITGGVLTPSPRAERPNAAPLSADAPGTGERSSPDEDAIEAQALARLKARLFNPGQASAPADAPGDESAMRTFAGRYSLLRRLGRGGAGSVYLARDEELHRQIALKVISLAPDDPEAEVEQRRLEREARALARMRHPNVVQVFDSGTYEDERAIASGRNRGAYLVLEYIEGESLHDWSSIQRPWTDVLAVYIQAARGLVAAHERGVVHRDFKPSNALLGTDGVVRVVDFGLAAGEPGDFSQDWSTLPGVEETRSVWGDRLTGTGMVVGTPAYMAPERFSGAKADEASDQFSFCVALFESLYGDWPFAGSTARQLKKQIMKGQIDWVPNTEVPEHLRKIVARGLSGRAADRYPGMAALCEALEEALLRSIHRAARRRLAMIAAAVLVTVAVASVAWAILA